MIAKYNEYNSYLEMADRLLNNLKDSNLNESQNVNDILQKTLKDLKLNFKLISTFGFGIAAFMPIVKGLINNMSLNFNIDNETYVLLTLTALSIIFLEENRDIEDAEILRKDCKSLLEELRMRGLGDGIVKKITSCITSIKKIFNSIGKHLGIAVTGLMDMFSYSFLLIPVLNGLSALINDFNINLDNAKGNFMGILLGISGLAAKHGISYILNRIKGLDRSTFLKISDEFGQSEEIDDSNLKDVDSKDMIKEQ